MLLEPNKSIETLFFRGTGVCPRCINICRSFDEKEFDTNNGSDMGLCYECFKIHVAEEEIDQINVINEGPNEVYK